MHAQGEWTMPDEAIDRNPEPSPTRPTLLVVEPYAAVAESLEHQCARLGWHVVGAADTAAVTGLLDRCQPQAVLLSLTLPDPESAAVLQAIAAFDDELPVLCLIDQREGSADALIDLPAARLPRRLQRAMKPLRHRSLAAFLATAD